jgi:uncharacterized cupredoxin-like copper-binding protein
MKLSRPLRSAVIAMGLVAVACGGSDKATTSADGAGSTRTVEVTMVDNRFEPATLIVGRGEKVKFVFRNNGSVVHDAFVGDAAAQAMHETDMMGGGGGHDGHGAAGDTEGVIVEPGMTGTLTHTFGEAGAVEIGCHEPGHFAGGMKMAVAVS